RPPIRETSMPHIKSETCSFSAASAFRKIRPSNMSKALQRGIGVGTNSVEAYAWLQVAADFSTVPIVQRGQLNNMALIMDSRSIDQAQALAQRFKAGAWRCPAVGAISGIEPRQKLNGGKNADGNRERSLISEVEPHLKLNGITLSGKSSLCI